jgi:hypothetical protein
MQKNQKQREEEVKLHLELIDGQGDSHAYNPHYGNPQSLPQRFNEKI